MTILKRRITRPVTPASAPLPTAVHPAPATPVSEQTSPPPTDALLLPAEVAARLRVSEKALEHWRRRGLGPRFLRLGARAVRYRKEDVDDYIQQR